MISVRNMTLLYAVLLIYAIAFLYAIIIILFTMDDSTVIDTNAQGTGVGAKLSIKLSNSGINKKIVYIVAESNNLQSIHAKAQLNFGPSVEIYKDEQISTPFRDDQDILDHLSIKRNKIYCSNLPQNQLKKTQSLSIEVPVAMIQFKKGQSMIAINEPLTPLSSKQIRLKKSMLKIKQQPLIKKEKEVKVETKTIPGSLVHNLQQAISKILKSNHSELAQHFLPRQSKHNDAKFDIPCHFCNKNELKDRIAACEANLHVVACQQCSKYLAYQLPFPFKVYTSPQQYAEDRDKQPQETEIRFGQLLQHEKQQRNRRIHERLMALRNPS